MSGTIWSKFFWADWLSDVSLRRCSFAARGLWIEMLCVAAQAEPQGYLMQNGYALDARMIARIFGAEEAEVRALIDELEVAGVLSRDRKGCIYSRRMVRDAKMRAAAGRNGKKGGVVSRDNKKGIFARSGRGSAAPRERGPAPISHKPESKSHKPESMNDGVGREPLVRAAAALGVQVETLRRRTGWIILGDMIEGLAAEGCEVERDVWPTIARVAKRLSETPATPLYFKTAILDARDRRRAREAPEAADAAEWQDRLAVFAAEGAWSTRWGPRPGEAGCLAPDQT